MTFRFCDPDSKCKEGGLQVHKFTKPCADLINEIDGNRKLSKTKKDGSKTGRYFGLSFETLLTKTNAPVEVAIKIPKGKGKSKKKRKDKVIFHCSLPIQNQPWCVTKFDNQDKIERWGYCSKQCIDESDGFMYANMNLLTNKECETLFKECKSCEGMAFNKKYEFCAGKKHELPTGMLSFTRRKKKKKMIEKEKKLFKRKELPPKFHYKLNPSKTRMTLNTREGYPYDWIIGDVDSCQGDSGGPMHRNIKVCFKYNKPF